MSFVLNCAKNPYYTYREGEGKRVLNEITKTESDGTTQNEIQSADSSFSSIFAGTKNKLLVSIGSGVSMIMVNPNNGQFERVSGTMIGGGTLVGLSNLLTGVSSFDEIIKLSQAGDNSGVDMLVRDIYGDNMPYAGLKGEWLASSFAKVANDHTTAGDEMKEKYKREDILHSLMYMISFNIGQLACFASQIHDIDDIFFVGNYLKNNPLGMEKISFAVDLMSQQKARPLFITYDGYLGAIGAFMQEFQDKSH